MSRLCTKRPDAIRPAAWIALATTVVVLVCAFPRPRPGVHVHRGGAPLVGIPVTWFGVEDHGAVPLERRTTDGNGFATFESEGVLHVLVEPGAGVAPVFRAYAFAAGSTSVVRIDLDDVAAAAGGGTGQLHLVDREHQAGRAGTMHWFDAERRRWSRALDTDAAGQLHLVTGTADVFDVHARPRAPDRLGATLLYQTRRSPITVCSVPAKPRRVRVTDGAGAPLTQQVVSVWVDPWLPADSIETDARGTGRIRTPVAGLFLVRVRDARNDPFAPAHEVRLVAEQCADEIVIERAAGLDVAESAHVLLRPPATPRPRDATWIDVRVTGPRGETVSGVLLEAMIAGACVGRGMTDGNGWAWISVGPTPSDAHADDVQVVLRPDWSTPYLPARLDLPSATVASPPVTFFVELRAAAIGRFRVDAAAIENGSTFETWSPSVGVIDRGAVASAGPYATKVDSAGGRIRLIDGKGAFVAELHVAARPIGRPGEPVELGAIVVAAP